VRDKIMAFLIAVVVVHASFTVAWMSYVPNCSWCSDYHILLNCRLRKRT
jgi:hypothetical protein